MKGTKSGATPFRRFGLGLLVAARLNLCLSGCAYQELTAPCSRDDGAPVTSYAEAPAPPQPFASMDRCGALKPLNKGPLGNGETGAGDGGLHRGE